jgi:hypothetical protein
MAMLRASDSCNALISHIKYEFPHSGAKKFVTRAKKSEKIVDKRMKISIIITKRWLQGGCKFSTISKAPRFGPDLRAGAAKSDEPPR